MAKLPFLFLFSAWLVSSAFGQTVEIAESVKGPQINGGARVEGSVRLLTGDNVTLNGGAVITGDLFVPGKPTVTVNGRPQFGGVIEGAGLATPSNYTVLINGNASLRNVVRRTDGYTLPAVAMTGAITGTRSVVLNSAADPVGDWTTVRNLTFNGNAGRRVMPPGRYGTVSLNANCTLAIGAPGALQTYQFESLNLNGKCKLEILGPVVVRVKNAATINAHNVVGNPTHPDWFRLENVSGGVTINGHGILHGFVLSPSGTVIVNGQAELIGGVRCHKLIVNGGGLLRLAASNGGPAVNAGADQEIRLPASATLSGTATDDGSPAALVVTWSKVSGPGSVTFANPAAAATTASFSAPGEYVLRLTATDSALSVSDEVGIIVRPANQPPTVSLSAPIEGARIVAQSRTTIAATAGDDQGIARVEFFVGRADAELAKIGEDATAPYTADWTPALAGPYSIEARAVDTDAVVARSTLVKVVVEEPNHAPIAENLNAETFEDEPKQLTLTYSDPDGDVLVFSHTAPAHGSISGTAPQLVYTPSPDFHGTDSFAFTVTDPAGLSATATVTLVVRSVNDLPFADAKSAVTGEDEAVQVELTGRDVDGDSLTFSAFTTNGTATVAGSTLTYQPASNFHGDVEVTIWANDGKINSAPALVTITVRSINDAPTVTLTAPPDNELVDEGRALQLVAEAADVDGSVSKIEFFDGNLKIGETTGRQFEWTPPAGSSSIKAVATDNEGASGVSAVHAVRVNSRPEVNAGPDQRIRTNEAQLAGTATDDGLPNPQALFTRWNFVSGPGEVSFADRTALQTTVTFSRPGLYELKLVASDTRLEREDLITVHVNAAPAVPANTFQTEEDTSAEFVLQATDADEDTLTFALVSQPSRGSVTLTDRSVRFVPELNFVGTTTFEFSVDDSQGGKVIAVATIDVIARNDAPVASDISFSTGEDTGIEVPFAAVDPEQDPLTFVVVTPPGHGTVSGSPLRYLPETNYSGPDTFTYRASDATLSSEIATATVTVTAINDAPAARPGHLNMNQGGTLQVKLSGTDAEGSPLQYEVQMSPEHGTLSGQAPNLVYTPSPEYVGTDSLNYRVYDGELWSIPRAITILVSRINHLPVGVPQDLVLEEDSEIHFLLSGSDQDHDPMTYAITAGPSHGSVTGTAPGLTYRPHANYHGTDTLQFSVHDGIGSSDPVQIRFTIRPINDAPVTQGGVLTVREGSTVPITLKAADADQDPLQYIVLENVSHGTLTGSGGTGQYTPHAGYLGADKIRFKVSDGRAESNISEILITVAPKNDPPASIPQTLECDEDTSLPVVLSATDPEQAALIYTLASGPSHGEITGTPPNVTYNPAKDFAGNDSFSFKATDGSNTSTAATVSITVKPINDAPVAVPLELRVVEGESVSWSPSATDVDSPEPAFEVTQAPSVGSLTGDSPNFVYHAPEAFVGEVLMSYQATDDRGAVSDPATVRVRVVSRVRSRTYTTTSDFQEGTLSKLTTEIPDQLSVTSDISNADYVWIPVYSKGTVVCIDSDSGVIVAEYQTCPTTSGIPYASRTSIDSKGNVWIANERDNSLVKIANPAGDEWVDRNNNGVCDTSAGQDDVRPWLVAGVQAAADERILLYVKTTGTLIRHVSVDSADNVWAGGSGIKHFDLFNGKTGALIRSELATGRGGNGGFVDSEGVLWSTGTFLRWPLSSSLASVPATSWSLPPNRWGVAKDSEGNAWVTHDPATHIDKYNFAGNLVGSFPHGASWSQGVAVDFNDHVWVAHSHCGDTVGHLLNDGTWLGNIQVARHGPTGVAVDRKGRIWVAGTNGVIQRINPLGGPIGKDGVTPVGEVDYTSPYLGGNLWAYSLFTGPGQGVTTKVGRWTLQYDGQIDGTQWGPVVWNGELANDASFKVFVSLSDNEGSFPPYQELTRENRIPSGTGRFISVRVDFDPGLTGASPILHDLTIGTAGYTTPEEPIGWRITAGNDINGKWPDPIPLRGLLYRTTASPPIENANVGWSKLSGPGQVSLDDSSLIQPMARFSLVGDYAMRLTATYLGETRYDDLLVHLVPYNKSPWTDAGSLIVLRSVSDFGQLNGVVRDDGLPEGAAVTSLWQKLTGPGSLLFGDASAPQTTVRFSQTGLYSLKLSASDTEYTHTSTVDARVGVICALDAAPNIVSWWQANHDGADHITGNQAFLEGGATYVDGKVGAAWSFDGVNDVVRVLSGDTLDIAREGSFTVEGWINIPYDYHGAFHQPVISWSRNGVNGFAITVVPRDGSLSVSIPGRLGGQVAFNNVPCGVNAWHHVAVSYDSEKGIAALYIDSNWVRAEYVEGLVPDTTGELLFGNGPGRPFFKGALDEMAIYNRALSAGEVSDIVLAGSTGRCPFSINKAPVVNAGPDCVLYEVPGQVSLQGSVVDEGFPAGLTVLSKWSVVSGPGAVIFGDDRQPVTTAYFSTAGTYVLKLAADDGFGSSNDLMQVRVDSACSFTAPEGIAAWLPFDGSIADQVGHRPAAAGGGRSQPGKVALAHQFDGVNDFIRMDRNPALDIGAGSGMSVEFWINPSYEYYRMNSTLLEWHDFASGGFRIRTDQRSHNLLFDLKDTGGVSHPLPPVFVGHDAWRHVALSYDRASGWVRVFVDGTLKVETHVGSFAVDTRKDLYIGYSKGNEYYLGLLDELSLYNRALDASEMYAIYLAGGDGKCLGTGNAKPIVNAGGDREVPNLSQTLQLSGSVSDDGIPGASLHVKWEKRDGPGNVSFTNAASASTGATFDTPGIYVLRITGSDGLAETSDEMEVRVATLCSTSMDSRAAAWWSFNGHSRDMVGANHARSAGGAFQSGKVSQAIAFNGSTDFLRVPASEALDVATGQGMTIEFWIKPGYEYYHTDSTVLEWSNLVSRGLRVSMNQRGHTLSVDLKDTQGVSHPLPPVFLGHDNWRHVAISYDKQVGIAKIFVDGNFLLSNQISLESAIIDTRWDLYLGYSKDKGYFLGALDEVAIYKEALDDAEIYDIYAAGGIGKCPYGVNGKPIVDAGADGEARQIGDAVALNGSVSDDGLPLGSIQSQWSKVDGPGTVTFNSATSAATTAMFSSPGIYLLRLTGSDGAAQTSDEVEVRVATLCSIEAPSGLAAWWPFNGNSRDTAGRHSLGRNGGTYETGKVSQALKFDGANTFLRAAAHPELDLGNSPEGFACEFWIKPGYEYYHTDCTVFEWNNIVSGGARVSFNHRGHTLHVDLKDINNQSHPLPAVNLGHDAWHHVAITYDKRSGYARIFVDGSLSLANQTHIGPIAVATTQDLYVGYSSGRNYFLGVLDELSFYSHPLDPADVYLIYDSKGTGKCPQRQNEIPLVNAGADKKSEILSQSVSLDGATSDDGLPGGSLVSKWTKVAGPGTANFEDADSPRTHVSFSVPGIYILRLTADDALATSFDDVEVRVGTSCSFVTDQRLAAWWPLNGSETDVVAGRDLRRSGGGYESGRVSMGLRLDGADDYVRAYAAPSLDIGAGPDGFTVECWINPGYEYYHTDSTILEWSDSVSGGLRVSCDQRGHIVHVNFKDRNGISHSLPGVSVGHDAWRHLGITYQRSTGMATVLLDGVARTSMSVGQIDVDTRGDLFLGYSLGRGFFLGLLDEVSLYSSPLSNSEIALIYQSSATGKCPVIRNTAPAVNVGPDLVITLPEQAQVLASAIDDGLPTSEVDLLWTQVSGPGTAVFAEANSLTTSVSFSAAGSYVLRLTASDGELEDSDEMVVRVAGGVNLAPTVDAGSNQNVSLDLSASLSASVSDDGLPFDSEIRVQWAKVSGPAPIIFSNASNQNTLAQFTAKGTYVLRATASDGQLTSSDTTQIVVGTAGNHPPVVELGEDRNLTLTSWSVSTDIADNATDDGIPNVDLHVQWSQVSGPGGVQFSQSATGMNATFFRTGQYRLRCEAFDGDFRVADEITVRVTADTIAPTVVWQAPAEGVQLSRGTPVTLSANATDPDGAVTMVEFYVNDVWVAWDDTAPYSVQWVPTVNGSATLRAMATDNLGATAETRLVQVQVVTAPPMIAFVSPNDQALVVTGTAVNIAAVAGGGLPVERVEFKVTPSGFSAIDAIAPFASSWTPTEEGDYQIEAKVYDAEGRSATASRTVHVMEEIPDDAFLEITSPAPGTVLTEPTDVKANIAGSILKTWKAEYRLLGQKCNTWTTFLTGTAEVNDDIIGKIDTTLIPYNGVVEMRVVATDLAGRIIASASVHCLLEGDMKIGAFTTTVEDLSVAGTGLPLSIIRTYNSHDKCPGDFGVGWNLDVATVKLVTNYKLGEQWMHTIFPDPPPFGVIPTYSIEDDGPHVIAIVFPDGKVHRFRPVAKYVDPNTGHLLPPARLAVPWRFFNAFRIVLEPLPGTVGTLTGKGIPEKLYPGDDQLGEVVWLEDDAVSDPFAPVFTHPTGWEFAMLDGRKYEFDADGKLLKFSDRNNNSVTITETGIFHSSGKGIAIRRDSQGRISTITDPRGSEIKYLYDEHGDLIRFTDREGNASSYGYTQTHDLISVRDPFGAEQLRVEYDAEKRLRKVYNVFDDPQEVLHNLAAKTETKIDALGNSTTLQYNSRGEIVQVVDAMNGVHRSEFDERGNKISTTDPLGYKDRTEFDDRNLIRKITDKEGNVFEYTYTVEGFPETLKDARGNVANLVYDDRRNVAEVRLPLGYITKFTYDGGGRLITKVDPGDRVTTCEFDAYGNMTASTDPTGHRAEFVYDANGNRLTQMTTRTKADGTSEVLTTKFVYDKNDRLLETIDPLGHRTKTVYDAAGRAIERIDELNRSTSFDFDEAGRLVRTTYPDATFEETRFDALGRAITKMDRRGKLTSFEYDKLGRLRKTILPDGSLLENRYDEGGRLVTSLDARQNSTAIGYDRNGRRTSVTDALNQTTAYRYDGNGNLVSCRDALQRETKYEYDALDRKLRTVFPDGTSERTIFNEAGEAVEKVDQANVRTYYRYDLLSRLTEVMDSMDHLTRYSYDELGNLVVQTDANGHATRYECDAMGRRIKRTLPMGMSESLARDAAGNVVSRTDFNGYLTTYRYDFENRLILKTPDPRLDTQPVQYNYSASGKRLSMVDGFGTTSYVYDDLDRRVAKTSPNGRLNYAYDENGNVVSIRSSNLNGVDVVYEYDRLDRLAVVDDANTGRTTYTYNEVGSMASVFSAQGLVHSYAFDSLNRLRTLNVSSLSGVIDRFDYELDPCGHRVSVVELSGRRVSYTYDSLHRLKSENVTFDPIGRNGSVNYVYDAVGNRLSQTSTLPGVLTRGTQFDANDRQKDHAYDRNGNTKSAGGAIDSYDFEDRLIGRNNGQTIVYDGDGNKVRETIDGAAVSYLVDDLNPTGYSQVLEEITNGVVTRVYTYGLTILSQDQLLGGDWISSFYVFDGNGNVRFLTDDAGMVTDTYTYDAFGNLIHNTGSTANKYRFAGEEWNEGLGMYYLRARFMNPLTGRFWNADTYEGKQTDPQSLHKYLYCNSDPVNNVDPSGHFPTLGAMMCNLMLTEAAAWAAATEAGAEGGKAEMERQKLEMQLGMRDTLDGKRVMQATVWAGTLAYGLTHINTAIGAMLAGVGPALNALTARAAVSALRAQLAAETEALMEVANFLRNPSLPATTAAIGVAGELRVVTMLAKNHYTKIFQLQNGSGNGVDIIAMGPNGKLAFFEVKATGVSKIADLSSRQKYMDQFLDDVLPQAAKGTGRYSGLSPADQKLAAEALRRYRADPDAVSGTAVGVDLQKNMMYFSRWARSTD